MSKKEFPWKSKKEGFIESLQYMRGRKDGIIKSVRTPWPKVNDALVEGIEWNTMNVIAGRPGSFKTGLKDQIIRESFSLNPTDNFRVLEFSFEMLSRSSAIREYSSFLGKSYKYLCSAEGILNKEDFDRCHAYAKSRVNLPIDIIEEACTINELKEFIGEYMDFHAVKKPDGSFEFTKTIITIDHTLLLKKSPFEKDKYETVFNLGEAITALKKKYPILFIVLTQLNRNIDNPERCEDGKYGNYVLESDVFGGEQMLQFCDNLIALNRPGKQKIRFYGPDRYIIEDDRTLVMHFLKCRNGDNRMSFFKAEFDKMRVVEMPTPPQEMSRRSKF